MANHANDKQVREQFHRMEMLLQEVDRGVDPAGRKRTQEIVKTLMDLHGAGLERILEQLAATGPGGLAQIDAMARDELVSGLLLLYGLHPQDLDTRVGAALEKVRPYLHSHGGNVQLLSILEGVVRLRLQGSCHGCPSSAQTLKQTIEEAIYEKAPDVVAIQVEGEIASDPIAQVPAEAAAEAAHGRVALPILAG